jgi:hypothetical protein
MFGHNCIIHICTPSAIPRPLPPQLAQFTAVSAVAAVALHVLLRLQKGKEGVRGQYETTEEFHEKWKMKARDMLAKSEWRRRKLTKRVSQQQQRHVHAAADSICRGKGWRARG